MKSVDTSVVKDCESLSSFNSATELKPESETDENEVKVTNWKLVIGTGIVCFLSSLEATASGMSEWPYMSTFDPKATSQFYGTVSSVSKVGHAIFAIIFCLIYYKFHSVKIPLIIGRVLAFIGCVLYLGVELAPSNKRYIMMLCYFIFGIATSSSAVLRMYIVEISTTADRARAYSAIALATLMSVIVGPIIQICFSGIKYPGKQIFPNVRFHIFSAPIWIATFLNIVSVIVILVVMKSVGDKKNKKKGFEKSSFTVENLKKKLDSVRKANVAWFLVVICWLEKIGLSLANVTLGVVMGPFSMIAFNWDPEKTVVVTSIAMGAVGVLSLCVAGTMMTPCVGKRMSPRWMFLFAMSISILMYVFSYPYPFTSHPIQSFNETTRTGCNPEEYSWCEGAIGTSPWVFLTVVIIVFALGIPLGSISLDTIYSKIFGDLDQTVMQGAMVAVEDFVQILGPLYASWVFTTWGQGVLWIVNAIITVIACLIWLLGFPRMQKYK